MTPTSASPTRLSQANAQVDVPLAASRGSLPGAIERARTNSQSVAVEPSSSSKQRLMYYSRVGVIPAPGASPVSYSGTPVRSATDMAVSDRRMRTSISGGDTPDPALAVFVPPHSSIIDYIFTKVMYCTVHWCKLQYFYLYAL